MHACVAIIWEHDADYAPGLVGPTPPAFWPRVEPGSTRVDPGSTQVQPYHPQKVPGFRNFPRHHCLAKLGLCSSLSTFFAQVSFMQTRICCSVVKTLFIVRKNHDQLSNNKIHFLFERPVSITSAAERAFRQPISSFEKQYSSTQTAFPCTTARVVVQVSWICLPHINTVPPIA